MFSRKADRVHEVFSKIATRYDLMNELISFGLHRRWKKRTVELSGINLMGEMVLDLGCGSGDYLEIALKASKGALRKAVGVDFSENMLEIARNRLKPYIDKGLVSLVKADVQDLSFLGEGGFILVTCGFTLRNVEDISKVVRGAFKKLKPGGAMISLDLNKPVPLLIRPASYLYVRLVLPVLAQLVAGARKEYLWLFESLKSFPSQNDLRSIFKQAGFEEVKTYSFGLGVVCAHIAFKR